VIIYSNHRHEEPYSFLTRSLTNGQEALPKRRGRHEAFYPMGLVPSNGETEMLKALVVIFSLNLVITPAIAEANQKPECSKSFIGIDDALLMFAGAWLFITVMEKMALRGKIAKLEEELKAKTAEPKTCTLTQVRN
jgi:hypothetical protein